MAWLLRLLLIRILGPRAVTILALLGLIRVIRGARTSDGGAGDPAAARARARSSPRNR